MVRRAPRRGAEAVEAAVEYLRERGNAQKRHFLDAVPPEHPAGYHVLGDEDEEDTDGDGRDRSGWWRQVVRPVLQQLPVVETSSGWYRYVGDDAQEGEHGV